MRAAMSFFVALDLDTPVRGEVTALMATLSARVPAKWLRPDKLHCTLRFLGHPTEAELEAIRAPLTVVARRRPRFSLELAGAGTFVTARAPSVLWLGVDGEMDALRTLQREVSAACGGTDEKPYVPHVTLARGQDAQAFEALAAELQTFRSARFEVGALVLYESQDHRYHPVWSLPLEGA